MATLQPRNAPSVRADLVKRDGYRRYYLDRTRLLGFFGGETRVQELTRIYGLPDLVGVDTPATKRSGIRFLRITLTNVLVMLELGERMKKPLDLYQFICEER